MEQKYKIVKTSKDFIQFIKDKVNEEKDEKWLFGNLFQLKEGDFEKTDNFEIKYWTFKKTKNSGHELKVQRNATEYTFIITGEITGRIEDKKVSLKTGDYIIIKPGIVNNLVEEVIEDVIGITIKAPSSQGDTVKIKKEFIQINNKDMCKKFKNSIKDKKRFWGAVSSLIIGLFIVIVLPNYFGIHLIYPVPLEEFSNYPRFLWCLGFSFFGFFLPAFKASLNTHDDNALISYPFGYLPILIIIPCLVFVVLHIFEATRNYLFYYFSASLCLMFSYFIDNVINEGPIGIFRKVR